VHLLNCYIVVLVLDLLLLLVAALVLEALA